MSLSLSLSLSIQVQVNCVLDEGHATHSLPQSLPRSLLVKPLSRGGNRSSSMNVAGASKRPRPRVRDAVSIDLDAEADAGSRKLSTSASPLNKSTFDRTRSLTEQTFDDEDDFFNRAMRRRGMSKTTSLDPTDLDMALSYDDQTVGKDEDTDQQSDSSAHNGYKPRRARAYHAAWARTESAPSKRVRRSRSSSTSTEDGEDALTFGHGTEGSPSTRDQTGPKRKRKIQEVDSPELTPPPEIEQESE